MRKYNVTVGREIPGESDIMGNPGFEITTCEFEADNFADAAAKAMVHVSHFNPGFRILNLSEK